MANSPQAKKRVRQSEKDRIHNAGLRSRLRTHIKKVDKTIVDGNKDEASEAYRLAVPIIDAMVSKGLLHKNKAARQKSRLNKHILHLK